MEEIIMSKDGDKVVNNALKYDYWKRFHEDFTLQEMEDIFSSGWLTDIHIKNLTYSDGFNAYKKMIILELAKHDLYNHFANKLKKILVLIGRWIK